MAIDSLSSAQSPMLTTKSKSIGLNKDNNNFIQFHCVPIKIGMGTFSLPLQKKKEKVLIILFFIQASSVFHWSARLINHNNIFKLGHDATTQIRGFFKKKVLSCFYCFCK